MIKDIFVPLSGTSTDDSVLATALAVARPLAAHMAFYHVRLSTSEAAVRSPHVQYCPGPVLGNALARLDVREGALSLGARQRVEASCALHDIAVRSEPGAAPGISAQLWEEVDQKDPAFVVHARHHDATVLARPRRRDLVSYNLIETVLKQSGRPVIIAADATPPRSLATIAVGWNDTAAAARALGAAMPLLGAAQRVLLVGIADDERIRQGLNQVCRSLAWHGIDAHVCSMKRRASKPPVDVELLDAAANLGADLLVVGGYGHMPLREIAFGGVTQSLIENAELPVFMMH